MPKNEKSRGFFIFAGLLAGSGYLYFFDPASKNTLYPPCLFHETTGLHCCACGTLRALHELLHGHFYTALSSNAVAIILLPFALYILLRIAIMDISGRKMPPLKIMTLPGIITILLLILTFGILRNLPFSSFSRLAP
jgi:hypothetical protein